MLFNSVQFLVFFPLVIAVYYLVNYKWRWLLLLVASYIFYGSWKIEFLSLIVISTLVDFYVAKQLSQTDNTHKRWKYLLVSLSCNLGMLLFFKYGSFLANLTLPFAPIPDWRKEQLLGFLSFDLPVGISFYTFQTTGYTIDILKTKSNQKNIWGSLHFTLATFHN